MTAVLMFALLLQAVSLALLRLGLGKCWLRRPVPLLVLVSVICQGVAPVLLSFPSIREQDEYLNGVSQSFADDAALILSAGMLALTVIYLLTSPKRGEVPARPQDAAEAARVLDWRVLALACAPLAVLTYEGRGYNDAASIGATTPVATELAATFFVILVVLTSAGFLLRHGTRWFLPVLGLQSLALTAAGERTPVIADAVALILLLAFAGCRPPKGQLHAAAALTLVAVLAITGIRTVQGRVLYHEDSGIGARVSALGSAFASGNGEQGPGLLAQAAVRLDGTSFAGAVLQSQALGQPRLSPSHVPESLLLAVPSAAWSGKQQAALNPVLAEMNSFGLQQVNYLPGLEGLYLGFLSPWELIVFLALLGVILGRGERWLMRRCTPARLVLLAGAVSGISCYQAGLPTMLVAFRPAVVIAAVAWLAAVPVTRRRTATVALSRP